MNNTKTNQAYIEILEGTYKDDKKKNRIYLQFNPEHYSVDKTNNYESKKLIGLKDVITQFKGGSDSDLMLELLFDSTDTGEDVRDMIKPLSRISDMDKELHAPPPCRFVWAGNLLTGVVSKLNKKFTFFYQNGTPARVRITLTLKPYKTLKEIKSKNKKHSSDISKKRSLTSADNLWLLAHKEYGDASFWRVIAKENEIDNPLEIENGKELLLPPKESL